MGLQNSEVLRQNSEALVQNSEVPVI
jgi:hypothetical protein